MYRALSQAFGFDLKYKCKSSTDVGIVVQLFSLYSGNGTNTA